MLKVSLGALSNVIKDRKIIYGEVSHEITVFRLLKRAIKSGPELLSDIDTNFIFFINY